MSMTRSDYEIAADAMRRARWEAQQASGRRLLDHATEQLAAAFAQTNPRFDREKFMVAAEWGENT